MLSEELLTEIREYLSTVSEESRVYIGCDSNRFQDKQGAWNARYTTAVVVHINNNNGCKVFCDSDSSLDYDQKKDRPIMRMMNEAYKAIEAYQQLELDLIDREVEIHLDINEDAKHGSNAARGQAVGYAMGVSGRTVRIKPDAHAASYAADHFVRGKYRKGSETSFHH